MKLILQTNLNLNLGADGLCIKNLLSCIENKDAYFIVTTGKGDGDITFEGIRGMSVKNKFVDKKFGLLKKFLSIVYWPDSTIYCANKIIALIKKLISENNIDEIIAFSGDFTSQFVAAHIKKKFPQINYKIVLWDPLPDINFIYKKRLNLKLNKFKISHKVLSLCDFAFMTQGIAEYYCREFPEIKNKITICGLPLLNKHCCESEFSHDFDGVYRFLYTGSLNQKVRSVHGVIRFFEFLEDNNVPYELVIAGGIPNKTRNLFNNINVKFLGRISKDAVLPLFSQSDLLVSIGNNNTLQTPSKTIDYISTGKKIIGFENTVGSQSMELLNDYSYSFILFEDKDYDLDQIMRFMDEKVFIKDRENILSKFAIHTKERNYAIIFKNQKN